MEVSIALYVEIKSYLHLNLKFKSLLEGSKEFSKFSPIKMSLGMGKKTY